VIRTIATFGAVPESAYSGLTQGEKVYDHEMLFKELRKYLDSTLKTKGGVLQADWQPGYNKILDNYLGPLPEKFLYNGKQFTAATFAANILKFNPDDYINITSFTHHPFYSQFILEVPDNFSNGSYYNLPLQDMIQLVKDALNNGYTIMWDADVSNSGFNGKKGLAMNLSAGQQMNPESKEDNVDAGTRQHLFENLTTQDDHLMHIVGIEKNKDGRTFFIVKNSWGDVGPYRGHLHVSENYFALNTISLVVPKAALSLELLKKLKK
jgi:bleomycin hydrolase